MKAVQKIAQGQRASAAPPFSANMCRQTRSASAVKRTKLVEHHIGGFASQLQLDHHAHRRRGRIRLGREMPSTFFSRTRSAMRWISVRLLNPDKEISSRTMAKRSLRTSSMRVLHGIMTLHGPSILAFARACAAKINPPVESPGAGMYLHEVFAAQISALDFRWQASRRSTFAQIVAAEMFVAIPTAITGPRH